jgi:hypothetical protein
MTNFAPILRPAIAAANDAEILRFYFVPVHASTRDKTAPQIFAAGHRFEMIRINAEPVPAKMV